MSYILDALKKAEEERRRGKGPDILAEPDGYQPVPRKLQIVSACILEHPRPVSARHRGHASILLVTS